ncbi:hypothetical protein ACWCP6_18100 [Streptomyces sp. NPDC002004]
MTVPVGFPINDVPLLATWPRVLVQIAWNAGGNSTAPNHWYTVAKRLRGSWKATLAGRQYELDSVTSGSLTFSLDNLDGAFDPDNTASPFYPYVLPYRRARLVWQTTPSQNLLYSWVADGSRTLSMAASTGTIGAVSGLSPSLSGLTTAQTWSLPNGTASFATFGVTGATQDWTLLDCDGTTVTPGAAYSFGVEVQLAAGGMSSLNMRARLSWFTLTGTSISTNVSSTVGITTSWTRLTVSGTAPAGAAFAVVSFSTQAATTAATTIRSTAWQLEQASAATSWTSTGSWWELWQGFVERWPQSYEKGGKYGEVAVTCVDSLAPLSQLTFQETMPAFLAGIEPASQQYVFDLATPSASPDVPGGQAFLATGGTLAANGALDIVGPNIVTGTEISSATDLGTLWNTPGPVTTLVNNQASTLGNNAGATVLQPWDGTDRQILPNGGWTRMICFKASSTPGTGGRFNQAVLWGATAPGFISGTGDKSVALGGVYQDGTCVLQLQNSSGTGIYVSHFVNVCDGDWHCLITTLSADGKTATITVDGITSTYGSGSSMGSSTYTVDAIGALLTTNGSGENTQPFNGDIAYFAQWNTALSFTEVGELSRGFALGWSGDMPSTRVARLLSLAQFHPGSAVPFAGLGAIPGQGLLGSVSLTGRTALDAIQSCADSDNGQFVVDRFGNPTLYGHLWRWVQNTPIVTFGENTAGSEVPYADDIKFEQDPAHLYNDIQITIEGAADATDQTSLQEASDTASQTAYFPQSLTRTINPATVQTGTDMADFLLSLYKDPHTRVGQITIDLAHSPTLQTKLAGLKFADLVRVMRRPALAPAKQFDGFIEQMEWSGDDTGQNLQLRLQISPASQYRYWIISAAWAALSSGIAAGVSTISVGPVNNFNGVAAQYVIPANYQMTLGYGTTNAETVTVQSVQTVSAGYSTVQLTLASPTANAHSSGDLICTPLPFNTTLPPGGSYPSCFDVPSVFGDTSPLIGF